MDYGERTLTHEAEEEVRRRASEYARQRLKDNPERPYYYMAELDCLAQYTRWAIEEVVEEWGERAFLQPHEA